MNYVVTFNQIGKDHEFSKVQRIFEGYWTHETHHKFEKKVGKFSVEYHMKRKPDSLLMIVPFMKYGENTYTSFSDMWLNSTFEVQVAKVEKF